MSLYEFLSDPAETPFLGRALNESLDDDARRAYADALATRAPERAEWLRLETELYRRAGDAATRARFLELSNRVNGMWVQILRRDRLLNCGGGSAEAPRVRFTFECPRTWESLAPTEDACVRRCDECGQNVHFTDDLVEAEAHARAGRCITVPAKLAQSASGRNYTMITGRPDPIGDWATKLFP